MFKTLDYLFLCEENAHVRRNLLLVFNPLTLYNTTGRHIVNKVRRWAQFLSLISYVIEHMEGTNNIMGGIQTLVVPQLWMNHTGSEAYITFSNGERHDTAANGRRVRVAYSTDCPKLSGQTQKRQSQ